MLNTEQAFYLHAVEQMKWWSGQPFGLDKISLDLIDAGLLELSQLRRWQLTEAGREALNSFHGNDLPSVACQSAAPKDAA